MRFYYLLVRKSVLLAAALLVAAVSSAHAASTTATQTASITIAARADVKLSSSTVTFPDSDPTTSPTVTDTEGAITVTAAARTGANSAPTLTVKSGGDLTDTNATPDTIPIANISWTGTGTNFNSSGTMSSSAQQAVAGWTGPGIFQGTMTFSLANSWSYPTGAYSATFTYTMTAP